MFVSRSKHRALLAQYERVLEQRDTARQEARGYLTALRTADGQHDGTDEALTRVRLARLQDAVSYTERITSLARAVTGVQPPGDPEGKARQGDGGMSHAPDTLPRAEDWRDWAACADPWYAPIRDFWFADDSDRAEARTATTICGHCTARDACLAAAVTEEAGRGQQSMFGIRGGLASKQRWNRKKRDAARAARKARAQE